MARKRKTGSNKIEIQYPPVTTKKWIPPDLRKKPCTPKPPPYPPQLTQKLTVSLLIKKWHEYKIINDCAVLLGDISLYHHRFTHVSNGLQGHAICIVAALYSKLCPCYHWCSRTLDEIVILGDRYFQKSSRTLKTTTLTIRELIKDLFIHSHKITICLRGETFEGLIYKDLEYNNKDYLSSVIKDFFESHECGVICVDSTPKKYFTVWKFRCGFFLFDAGDHDEMCWPLKRVLQGKGHSFVVRFPTTDRLVQVLQRQLVCANVTFQLIPVEIERIAFINTRYPACLHDTIEDLDVPHETDMTTCTQGVLTPVVRPPPSEEEFVDAGDDDEPDIDVYAGKDDEEYEAGQGTEKKKKIKKKNIIEKPRVESVTYFNYIVPERIGIMLAETHQDDKEFDRCYSLKDYCMALSALVHLRENKAKYWTTRIVTNCLRLGFRICAQSLILLKPEHTLKIGRIIKKIELNEKVYTHEINQFGAIGRLRSQDDGILDLLPAIKEVLSENDTIIINGPLVVAIWKEEGLFYMFDAHERDPNGFAIVKEVRVGSVMEAVDFIGGVACLTWFADLCDLVEMYMANVDRIQRNEVFVISTVEINDYVELPTNWNNFTAICPDRWILQGTFAQGDIKFSKETRNTQCTANCAIAITYAHLVKLSEWTSETVDEILDQGDMYYKKCIDHLERRDKLISPMLLVSELMQDYVLKDMLVCLDIAECIVNGVITIPEEYRETWNLQKGLKEFFKENDFGILTCRGISIAIIQYHGFYYYFDSHDRNNYGFVVSHGRACIQRFATSDMMSQVIMGNLGPDVTMALYNISKVVINIYHPIPPGVMPDEDDSSLRSLMDEEDEEEESEHDLIDHLVVERPLFNYTKITKKRALLRGTFHQDKPGYFEVSDMNKQTIGNLMAAPAMARVYVPNEWSAEVIDNILRTGQKIFDDSIQLFYKNLGKEREPENDEFDPEVETDEITTDNVVKEFKIGVNKFTTEFESVTEGMIRQDGAPLWETVKQFFSDEPRDDEDHKELIIHTDNMDVVMWKSGTLYYLFDPRPRDEGGYIYGKEEWSEVPMDATMTELEYGGEEDIMSDFEEDPAMEEEEGQGDYQPQSTADALEHQRQLRKQLEKEWREYGMVEGEGPEPGPVKHPQEYWDALAREMGKAYIMWATKPKFLVRHIIANIPPKNRLDTEFKLTKIYLKNIPDLKDVYDPICGPKPDEIAGDWNDWKEITYGQWILRGSMHEKNAMFPEFNRGRQSHANCLIALAYAYIYAMSQFNKFTIDQILKYGDRLYTATRRVRRKELEAIEDMDLTIEEIEEVLNRETYNVDNLVKTFCIGDESVAVRIEDSVVEGEVHAQEIDDMLDVSRGLEVFFNEPGNRLGILQSKTHTVAIFRMGVYYYMFDSHECGPHGITCQNGVACMTRFMEVQQIADLFLENVPKCGKNFFTIQEVIVGVAECKKLVKEELRAADNPLKITGFEPVMPGKSIIRGSISLEDPRFGKGANSQAAPIACVALAMTLIHHTEFYTKMIIDDVVFKGDEIYSKYIDRCDTLFNPWEEKLTVALSPKDFKIGRNRVQIELRQNDQTGVIDDKQPATQNLRKGIENFFLENCLGVLETDKFTAAIWQEEGELINPIYMFDPYARGPAGMPDCENGAACILRFACPKILSDHVISLIPDDPQGMFLITPIEIAMENDCKKAKKNKFAGQKAERKESSLTRKLGRFNFYKLPCGEISILRGTKSQNNRCYSRTSRGNQDVANCIVTYVMDKLIPISKWTYKNIDMILDMGDLLYKDSYMLYNPKDEKIGLETLIRDVVIKDIRVKISVGAPVLTAHFSQRLLTEALVACFNMKNFCIFLLDRWALALFKKCETYYMFDPADLNLTGNRIDGCGSAAVLCFDNIDKMIELLIANMEAKPLVSEVFRIIIAAVKQIERIPVGLEFNANETRREENLMPGPPRPSGSNPNCDRILFGHTKPHKNKKKK